MKKIPVLMLSLLTLPTYAQGLLSTLNQYQGSLSTPSSSAQTPQNRSTTPDVKPSANSVTSASKKCEENDQTSLPLAYVTSLIQEKDAVLDIVHDPRSGTLSVSSGDMISNCSSMLEWKLHQPEIMGKKSYAVEVKIKDSDICSAVGCTYKVAKVEKGEFKEYENMIFKPTLKGYEECLQKSGVIVGGKIVPDAIYKSPVSEKFSGLENSGRLLFVSHGPSAPMVKAKYGKFEHVNACDHYESAHPRIKTLLTQGDAERERLDAEASKLKDCKVDEYHKLADFIDKYEVYSSQLGDIRDRLILEAAKKSADAISKGKYTDEDLKILQDFDRYVIAPKVELAKALYNESLELDGDAKKAKQAELKNVLSQLAALNQKPYFVPAHVNKLLDDGKFEEAETLNSSLLSIENHKRLGTKVANIDITPEVAASRIASSRESFRQTIENEKERYEYKTGQSSGKAQEYKQLAARMRQNIQTRTQNYSAEIQEENANRQPGGYCYTTWWKTQKCIKEAEERIQFLAAQATKNNQVDAERAAEYDAKAKAYGELEAQGRRYVANQNGEPAPVEQPENSESHDNLTPGARTKEGNFTFQFNNGQPNQQQLNQQQPNQQQLLLQQQQQMAAQQQAMMTPNQYQYPINPYQQQNMFMQQQNPFAMQQQYPMMGQQNFMPQQQYGMNTFNYNSGVPQGQMMNQQQMMNPYGQYNGLQTPYMNQMNMYGGFRMY
jgi:hypothetical protein